MKKTIIVLLLMASLQASAATEDNKPAIGELNYYGKIDLMEPSKPPVIYSSPRIVDKPLTGPDAVYLRVPKEHRKDWNWYCGKYDACTQKVFFVKEDWYTEVYSPKYKIQTGTY